MFWKPWLHHLTSKQTVVVPLRDACLVEACDGARLTTLVFARLSEAFLQQGPGMAWGRHQHKLACLQRLSKKISTIVRNCVPPRRISPTMGVGLKLAACSNRSRRSDISIRVEDCKYKNGEDGRPSTHDSSFLSAGSSSSSSEPDSSDLHVTAIVIVDVARGEKEEGNSSMHYK